MTSASFYICILVWAMASISLSPPIFFDGNGLGGMVVVTPGRNCSSAHVPNPLSTPLPSFPPPNTLPFARAAALVSKTEGHICAYYNGLVFIQKAVAVCFLHQMSGVKTANVRTCVGLWPWPMFATTSQLPHPNPSAAPSECVGCTLVLFGIRMSCS